MRELGVAALALVLVACGGGTETSSSATNPERSETETTPAPAPSEAASPTPVPTEAAAGPSAGVGAADPVGALAPATGPVPESLACATHADCVLVAGVCSGVEPTNRSHEAETRRGIEMRRTVASCAAPPRREPTMVARCNAGACMAIEPP